MAIIGTLSHATNIAAKCLEFAIAERVATAIRPSVEVGSGEPDLWRGMLWGSGGSLPRMARWVRQDCSVHAAFAGDVQTSLQKDSTIHYQLKDFFRRLPRRANRR
jgi:hypothetical protein